MVVDVGLLLDHPPEILDPVPVVVVPVADPVHAGGVQAVTPHVLQGAVLVAVGGQLGVAVELAPQQPVRLAADRRSIRSDPADVLRLVRVHRLDLLRWRPHRD